MLDSKDIYGQEEILTHIRNAVKMNKPSNAYIIEGEAGSGKKLIANYYAALLECEDRIETDGNIEPCKKCRSCIQASSNNNADIIKVTHDKPNLISVDEIREQLVDDIVIKPYSYKYKIYIIDDADKMNQQAQNAILKTIEEPPEYAVIMLLVENKQALLPTIISRCISLSIKPVKEELIAKYLEENLNANNLKINEYIKFAGGNIGKAIEITINETYNEQLNEFVDFIKDIDNKMIYELNDVLKVFDKWKNDIDEKLGLMQIWFRDILITKLGNKNEGLFFDKYKDIINYKSNIYSYNKIARAFDSIINAKEKLQFNTNYSLTMEILFMELRKK